jgi:hypothetical protein
MKRIAFGIAVVFMAAGAGMDTSAGKVYANAKGMTLYYFDKDAANASTCYDACAALVYLIGAVGHPYKPQAGLLQHAPPPSPAAMAGRP